MSMETKKDPQKEYMDRVTGALQMLSQAPGWEMYVDVMNDIRGRWMVNLISQGKELHDFNRGVIEGINLLLNLPALYKNRTKTLD